MYNSLVSFLSYRIGLPTSGLLRILMTNFSTRSKIDLSIFFKRRKKLSVRIISFTILLLETSYLFKKFFTRHSFKFALLNFFPRLFNSFCNDNVFFYLLIEFICFFEDDLVIVSYNYKFISFVEIFSQFLRYYYLPFLTHLCHIYLSHISK